MKPRVYLDYNASTPLDPRVAEAMTRALALYGNPSSIHTEGRQARALIDEARVVIGRLIHADHRRIIFTSGGTEANNLAILGTALGRRHLGRHIITTAIEHSSVLNPCRYLEREGFEVTYVNPATDGVIPVDFIGDALRDDTILISVMLANNEVGTLQPIAAIRDLIQTREIVLHTDAVQALGKIPVDVTQLGAHLVSLSAHKIYGPKGAGALYVDPSVELVPLLRGGSHERGLRAGTENVVGIHGFAKAAALLLEEGIPDLLPLRKRLETGLENLSFKIVCKNAERLPNTVNFYSEAWPGESMVMAFDLEGISVSNGSACSAGIIEPSHVILALGYNEEVARSVIRVSFGKFTRQEDIDYFLEIAQRMMTGVIHGD